MISQDVRKDVTALERTPSDGSILTSNPAKAGVFLLVGLNALFLLLAGVHIGCEGLPPGQEYRRWAFTYGTIEIIGHMLYMLLYSLLPCKGKENIQWTRLL